MRITRRVSAAALAALLALASALAVSAPAAAAVSDITVLVFRNVDYTFQIDEEVDPLIEDLEDTGADVEAFDGGDGSAAAWTEALDGIDVLVIPEDSDEIYDPTPADTSALGVEAHAVLLDWVEAGGVVILSDPSGSGELFSFLTGVDLATGWDKDEVDSFLRVFDDSAWPMDLRDTNATEGFYLGDFAAEALAVITPLYLSDDEEWAGVAEFDAVGDGLLYYFGWDWYQDESEAFAQSEWVVALGELLKDLFDEPAEGGGEAITVDIRLELYYEVQEGPRVFEATGVEVGPGPELTLADEIANPSDFCGVAWVDIDPVEQLIYVEGVGEPGDGESLYCNFSDIVLTISSESFNSVELVSDQLLHSESESQELSEIVEGDNAVVAAVTVEGEGYVLDYDFDVPALAAAWVVDDELVEEDGLWLDGNALFSYEVAALAATGRDDAPLLAGAALLALLGGVAFVAASRKAARQS